MENSNVKEKRRLLTAFDIVIIAVVVVLAAAFLIWKASGKDASPISGGPVTENVTYTLELNNLPDTDDIAVGDKLVETVKNTEVGTIVAVDRVPYVVWNTNLETGDVVTTETELETLHLHIEVPCTVSESSVSTQAGEYALRVGRYLGIYGPGYYGAGYIIAVERS